MAEENPVTRVTQDEYETQLFNFSSSDFSAWASSAINDVLDVTTANLKASVSKRIPSEHKDSMENHLQSLLTNYKEKAGKPLEALEAQLPTFFGIPSHVLLQEDRVHYKKYTEENKHIAEEKVEDLKKKLRRVEIMTQIFQDKLRQTSELRKKSELIASLDKLMKDCEVFDEVNASAEDAQKAVHDIIKLQKKVGDALTPSSISGQIECENELLKLRSNKS